MKLSDLAERTIPVVSDAPIAKRLREYRGVNFIVLDEGEPPDVHGIPSGLEAYGRGWVDRGSNAIMLDGGPQGSRQGHPATAVNGFYWGADYDKVWMYRPQNDPQHPIQKRGVVYVRGRAGTPLDFLEKNITAILTQVFAKLPRKAP